MAHRSRGPTQGQLNILDAPRLVPLQRIALVGQLDGIALDSTGQVLYVVSTSGGIHKLDAIPARYSRP